VKAPVHHSELADASDGFEGLAEFVGEGAAAVMVCGPTRISKRRARTADTIVRWASIESRLRW
jgi:hypothetical protein